MRWTVTVAFAVMATSMPNDAGAQSEPPAALKALVLTSQYKANVARLFAGLPPDVFQRCAGLVSKGSRVTIVTPITFAADGYPTAGAWKQSFPVSGCGNDTTINFFFVGQPTEKILSIVGAPGDTRADPVLQRDAARYATIAAQGPMKGCATIHPRTTQDGGSRPDAARASATLGARQPWHEIWTMAGCGDVARIGVDFIPDATGTTISAHPESSATR